MIRDRNRLIPAESTANLDKETKTKDNTRLVLRKTGVNLSQTLKSRRVSEIYVAVEFTSNRSEPGEANPRLDISFLRVV